MSGQTTPRFLSPFEQSENFARSSPRKRMRIPSFSLGATNVTLQEHRIGREERSAILGRHSGFRGCTIWFTGLSGAGKTTVSFGLEKTLTQLGIPCYGIDGDNVRHGLCKNLGFSKEERSENIRRVAEVAKLFADAGVVCLASFISPFRADRQEARRIHEADTIQFIEVHVNTPLEICESRDPKKLYKKARAGQLTGFTGIDSAYEAPEYPDLVLESGTETEEESVHRVLQLLYEKKILPEAAMQQLVGPPVRHLFVTDEEKRQRLILQAELLPRVDLSLVDVQWLQVLAEGWASPLSGFMRERQYLQSLHFGQLLDLRRRCTIPGEEERNEDDHFAFLGPVNQSVPIVLPINDDQKKMISKGDCVERRIALSWKGRVLAILNDGEVFAHRKDERVSRQFGINDLRHPTIELIQKSGDWLLGGDLQVLQKIEYHDGLDEFRLTPLELREKFAKAKCDAVFVFQLRNPIHNGHALLMSDTRQRLLKEYKNPMLLLHPLGGWTKDDDVPLAVRIAQHKAVMEEGVLDPSWTVLAIFPSPMLYAGPTEVQWHARARLAAGVHTYIVGRDPAGIQDPRNKDDYLYDPSHGAKVLSMAPGLPNLSIIPFRVAAYDKKAGRMSFFDPVRKDDFDFISGTRMRTLAKTGQSPPDGFMAPSAWNVLANYYKQFL